MWHGAARWDTIAGMIQHIKAIYDRGVLRPLEPLTLDDQAVVSLAVEASADIDIANATLFDVFEAAGMIGCVKDAPSDLSSHPRHMEGFGGDAQ